MPTPQFPFDKAVPYGQHTITRRASSWSYKRGYYIDNYFFTPTLKAAKAAIDAGEVEKAWERTTAAFYNGMSKEKGSDSRWNPVAGARR